MNKEEFVQAVAAKSGLTKKDSTLAVNSLLEVIEDTLKSGENVQLIGFGTFSTKKRAARTGRNPKTGAEVQVPESILPHFKPGKSLKDAVAGT